MKVNKKPWKIFPEKYHCESIHLKYLSGKTQTFGRKALSLCNSYIAACPPVRGDDPLALVSGLSPVQADNPWYNYFIPSSSV